MNIRHIALASAFALTGAVPAFAQLAPDPPPGKTIDARPWPRKYDTDGMIIALFRPELDSWQGNILKARLVGQITPEGAQAASPDARPAPSKFGVVWITARTETDKESRELVLTDVTVDKVSFPTAAADEPKILSAMRKIAPTTSQVVSLDQVEAAIAMADQRIDRSVDIENEPPEIIFAYRPTVLVPIDGAPVWKPTSVSGVEKVLNTRALVLRYDKKIYVGLGGRFASAATLSAPFQLVDDPPAQILKAEQAAIAARQAPAPDQIPQSAKAQFESGFFPDLIVRTKPAELITMNGQPELGVLPGTTLNYVSNTRADIFIDRKDDDEIYVLISGRWFKSETSHGPWTYVPGDKLPEDFRKIPSSSPKSAVLASIPGTPEAQESLVANTIPQTATVDARLAKFESRFDGAPKFAPVNGTDLKYAANSVTPIIQLSDSAFFALDKGVWFMSQSPTGPWAVALSIPPEIYTIPATSALHYVTYVEVYGSEGDNVYVGYTPGYFGTVASDGVVVYGTGYPCDDWVGEEWYACPETYGSGAAIGWGPAVGWGLAMGYGWDDYWYDPWWGPWGGYWPGYWGGAVVGNVYGRWGASVVAGTAAAWADPWSGNSGRGYAGGYYNTATGGRGAGYAGSNFNAYTGQGTAVAGGARYNAETGRVVAGQGGATGNVYTGNAAAAGERTVVNTNTGRVTDQAGIATRSGQGATAAGAFNSQGAAVDASGAGYVHYDRDTGEVNKGGVADINGTMYAGRDGNVYKKEAGGEWQKVDGDGGLTRQDPGDRRLNNESLARDRGFERDRAAARPEGLSSSRSSFNRGSLGGGFSGGMGGFRGGGFRGGGRR